MLSIILRFGLMFIVPWNRFPLFRFIFYRYTRTRPRMTLCLIATSLECAFDRAPHCTVCPECNVMQLGLAAAQVALPVSCEILSCHNLAFEAGPVIFVIFIPAQA